MKVTKKIALLLLDLLSLRYHSQSPKSWYTTTDFIRDRLTKDGYTIEYDDENNDIIVNGKSLKEILKI